MNDNHQDPDRAELEEVRLTAYALGQLGEKERAEVEARLARSDTARQFVEQTRALSEHVCAANRQEPSPQPSSELRAAVEGHLQKQENPSMKATRTDATQHKSRRTWVMIAAAVCLLIAASPLLLPSFQPARETALTDAVGDDQSADDDRGSPQLASRHLSLMVDPADDMADDAAGDMAPLELRESLAEGLLPGVGDDELPVPSIDAPMDMDPKGQVGLTAQAMSSSAMPPGLPRGAGSKPDKGRPGKQFRQYDGDPLQGQASRDASSEESEPSGKSQPGEQPAPQPIGQPGSGQGAGWTPSVVGDAPRFRTEAVPFPVRTETLLEARVMAVPAASSGYAPQGSAPQASLTGEGREKGHPPRDDDPFGDPAPDQTTPGTEQYDAIVENEFTPAVGEQARTTFSIDVDTASYANVRRFLTSGQLPPPNAVRIEELINYFPYDYPEPQGEHPFSVVTEVAACPWNTTHRLLRIGLKGREIDRQQRGPSNLVFLLDVSGSMDEPNKLPLVKQGMKLLVKQLGEDDRVAIVTYASGTEVRLESTRGNRRREILDAIDALTAGGSTHGSAGIQLAYEQAAKHFIQGGTNRVLLATDGDLNVGVTDDDELVKLITEKAKSNVFLTVLGFGTGNLKDSKLEKLADKGNGSYAYIDGVTEAHKVLVDQLTGSLITIAKDVKIQVEFNPAEVYSYRLIGYENRVLANRDFADDKKDAGEIGAGHTVTALYEIVPATATSTGSDHDELKYQRVPRRQLTEEAQSGEMLTLRLRYKLPEATESRLLERVLSDSGKQFGEASAEFRFASAVAAFGMKLRGSQHAGNTLAAVEEYAAGALGDDPGGYRAEFIELVRRARKLRGE